MLIPSEGGGLIALNTISLVDCVVAVRMRKTYFACLGIHVREDGESLRDTGLAYYAILLSFFSKPSHLRS